MVEVEAVDVTARVLLVDDTLTVLMAEKMMLSGQGYVVDTARDGDEALEKVASFRPDIVLLDVVMPRLDGFEALRQLKEDESSRNIGVIMVTTKGEETEVERARELGCDDYLTKPLNKVELLRSIERLLEARTSGP
jgi:CheY-like chemotaxis protein